MNSAYLSIKSKRLIVYFTLTFIIVFAIYFLLSNFEKKVKVSNVEATAESENAFFVPPTEEKRGQVISGKITSSSIPTNPKVKHELQNENGERVVYLYSDNNNLELSLGLIAELQAESTGEKYSGIDIVNVTAIKLK